MYQHAFKENIHVPTTSIMQAKQDILTEFKVDNFISAAQGKILNI